MDDGTGELEDIWQLYIPPELRGAVTVHVAKPNGAPGARDVGLLYLLPAEPGTLAELRITRDLGGGGIVAVDEIVGVVDIGRDIVTSVRVYGDCDGPVSVGGDTNTFRVDGDLLDDVECAGTVGSFLVVGDASGDLHFGYAVDELTISGVLSGHLTADHAVWRLDLNEVRPASDVYVAGAVEDLFVRSSLDGDLAIQGTLDEADIGKLSGSLTTTKAFGVHIIGTAMDGTLQIGELQQPGVLLEAGEWSGAFYATSILGDVVIGPDAEFTGLISGNELNATISIYGETSGTIEIETTWPGSVLELHANTASAPILSGTWDVGDFQGAALTIGDPNEAGATVYGVIQTRDFTAGSIKVFGLLDDPNSDGSGGHIIVDGAFGTDDPNAPATIEVDDGFAGDTEFVTIDFYARLAPTVDDRWGDSAVVTIDGDDYYGNAPADHVFLVSRCKGDLDNDGDVDYYDIDPLLDAFGDGAAYAAAFPGLAGSRMFHGDLDCSGTIDYYDIDPFIARL